MIRTVRVKSCLRLSRNELNFTAMIRTAGVEPLLADILAVPTAIGDNGESKLSDGKASPQLKNGQFICGNCDNSWTPLRETHASATRGPKRSMSETVS